MTMDYDNWLVEQELKYRGWDGYDYECRECGKPMNKDKGYCSSLCYQASML
jgi:hypothetical protein